MLSCQLDQFFFGTRRGQRGKYFLDFFVRQQRQSFSKFVICHASHIYEKACHVNWSRIGSEFGYKSQKIGAAPPRDLNVWSCSTLLGVLVGPGSALLFPVV